MERTLQGTAPESQSAMAWRYQDYVVRPAHRRISHHGADVEVEDRVFDLILLLLQHRDRALERREIIETLWGRRPVSDATLRQLVHKARRVFDDDGERQAVIRTLYGRSLQWVAPLTPVAAQTVAEPEPVLSIPVTMTPAADPESTNVLAQSAPTLPSTAERHLAWGGLIGALLIVLTVGAGLAWWQSSPSRRSIASSPAIASGMIDDGTVSIAVLPFLDMDAGHGARYLSDGLTEELINQLGRFPQLRVAARTSAFVFRDKPVDVREAARTLGVTQVLEGSVQRSGVRIRVRVALVSASSGYELWSNEFDTTSGDLLNVEGKITRAVITELLPKLDTRTLITLQTHSSINPAAHDFYLVGLEYLNRRTTPDIEHAILYFRRAIQADPTYASAWNGVATAYTVLPDYNSDAPPDTHYADALTAANKAVELDSHLARAHAVLGLLHEEHWQWAQAVREFRLALQLDPSDATTHQWYAMYLWFTGDMQAALAQMRTAHELDPLSPIINADLGRALRYTGQTDAAIAQYRAAIALDPRFALTHLFLAEAYIAQSRNADALQETRTAIALSPSPHSSSYLAVLGLVQSLNGDENGARQQLAALESRSRRQYVSGVSLALLYAQFGDSDEVFANLSRAVADHDHLMLPAVASRSASWRTDTRFAQLLMRMGLPGR